MKAQLRNVVEHLGEPNEFHYQALQFWCPGCEVIIDGERRGGLHMLAVNTTVRSPSWSFDGNLEAPTLSPSILTRHGSDGMVCHSFLRAGVFEFLSDSTHQFAGQHVPMPDLPDWVARLHESTD